MASACSLVEKPIFTGMSCELNADWNPNEFNVQQLDNSFRLGELLMLDIKDTKVKIFFDRSILTNENYGDMLDDERNAMNALCVGDTDPLMDYLIETYTAENLWQLRIFPTDGENYELKNKDRRRTTLACSHREFTVIGDFVIEEEINRGCKRVSSGPMCETNVRVDFPMFVSYHFHNTPFWKWPVLPLIILS